MSDSSVNLQGPWEEMRQGNAEALLTLYQDQYSDLVSYGVQLSNSVHTAKDAVNDVFLNIWENREKLKPVQNVKAYLFACMRRKIFHPSYFTNETLAGDENVFSGAFETSYEDMLIAIQQSDELREKLQAALAKLTDRQKQLVQLKYFKNMDYREIEAATGISVKTAYNTIYNAIKTLAAELRSSLLVLLLLLPLSL